MTGIKTIICVLLASAVIAVEYDRECDQIEDEGFYCTTDLKRVHDCVYVPEIHDFYLGLRNEFTCPVGTRCSCKLDSPCPTNKISDICKPFEKLPPLAKSFAMDFRWHIFHKSLNPHIEYIPDYEESREGEVIRDGAEGRYFKKVHPYVKKIFEEPEGVLSKSYGARSELVMKDGEGGFTKYAWTGEKEMCKTSKVNHLPSFDFDHLDKYDLISSTRVGDKMQQKWYLETGRNSWAYDWYRRTLTVLYDPASHTVTPQKYYEVWIEGEGEHDHFTTMTFSHKTNGPNELLKMKPPSSCA